MSDEFTFEDAMNLPGNPIDRPKKKPKLQLSGRDGNAFFIIGRAVQTLSRNGYSPEDISKFEQEVTSGDYDNVLSTCMKWFDVS